MNFINKMIKLNKEISQFWLHYLRWLVIIVFSGIGFDIGLGLVSEKIKYLPNLNTITLYWFNIFFWILAFGWSAFLAAYAFQLHGIERTKVIIKKNKPKINEEVIEHREVHIEGYGKIGLPKSLQQFLLNFIGSITGFIILHFLIQSNAFDLIGWLGKLILITTALLGITGYLPYMLIIKDWLRIK